MKQKRSKKKALKDEGHAKWKKLTKGIKIMHYTHVKNSIGSFLCLKQEVGCSPICEKDICKNLGT